MHKARFLLLAAPGLEDSANATWLRLGGFGFSFKAQGWRSSGTTAPLERHRNFDSTVPAM